VLFIRGRAPPNKDPKGGREIKTLHLCFLKKTAEGEFVEHL